jgi:hypothetical protein
LAGGGLEAQVELLLLQLQRALLSELAASLSRTDLDVLGCHPLRDTGVDPRDDLGADRQLGGAEAQRLTRDRRPARRRFRT